MSKCTGGFKHASMYAWITLLVSGVDVCKAGQLLDKVGQVGSVGRDVETRADTNTHAYAC